MPAVSDASHDGTLRESPLHDRHVSLGASLAPFGGWRMPVQYPAGVVAEHTAVRSTAGLFDVSHLGKLTAVGPGAAAFVNACLTADLERIRDGQAQYTLCCDDTGGVVDDLIVYRVRDDEVLAVPNAANAATVAARLVAAAPAAVEITDRHTDLAVLAVQGPVSAAVLDAVGLACALDYMAFVDTGWRDVPVRVCRTGYTGERGYELLVGADAAGPLWDALLAAVTERGGLPCGLGARDTLRTEMGYPLHGQDLSPGISPLQARAGWAVGWRKPAFWGRDALLAEKQAGPTRRLHGLRATSRGVPRPGMDVRHDGERVGVTTSGTFSPTLRIGIALALLDTYAGLEEDRQVEVDVRGRPLTCTIVVPPFVPSRVR